MKIMVIDFSETNQIVKLFPEGINLLVENKDGGHAYQLAGEHLPAAIFINYKDKPSHGRQTAVSIRDRKKTSHIPIYFIDGSDADNEKVSDIGTCVKSNEINRYLRSEV